jgi:hypothetical protein
MQAPKWVLETGREIYVQGANSFTLAEEFNVSHIYN